MTARSFSRFPAPELLLFFSPKHLNTSYAAMQTVIVLLPPPEEDWDDEDWDDDEDWEDDEDW